MADRPILLNGNQIIVNGYLNKYLTITGQRFPYKSSTKKKLLYVFWQFFVCCCVGAYFVFKAFGLYLLTNTRYTAAELLAYYPVTTIEQAAWEFRWLITCYIGIIFYNNIALSNWNYLDGEDSVFENKPEENVLLPDDRWKEVKQMLIGLGIALLLLCLLSVICDLAETDFNLPHDDVLWFTLHAIAKIIDRLFAFPFFLLLCLVVYILGSMVESYGMEIESYREDNLNGARKRFKEIKQHIRTASLSFQLYWSVHLLLLLCTFFLGVCSCFEQMEVRISKNFTLPSPLLIPDYAQTALMFEGNVSSNGGLLMHGFNTQWAQSGMQMLNSSSGNAEINILHVKWITKTIKMIVVDMAVKTFESLLLYLVPVWLMSRLEHQLRLVVERIEDSECEKQKEDKKLFGEIEQIRCMCKYIKTATGVKIFGYTVPKFQTFMLAAFGPFAALIIRSLLLHIGIDRK